MTWHILRLGVEEMTSTYGRYMQIYRISSRGQLTDVVLQLAGLGVGLITPHPKNKIVTKCCEGPWTDSLDKCPKLRKMDMRSGMWNIRHLYRAGLFMTFAKEI
jgi:hypothetical protein